MKVATFRESNWKRLMIDVEQRRVVPVIGAELLEVSIEGKRIPLYMHVAEELAKRLDVEIQDAHPDLSEIVYAYTSQLSNDTSTPYYEVWDILGGLQKIDPPEPLRQLARIEPFDLFLSTTCDDLMVKALNLERFQGESKTRVLSFRKRGAVEDIPFNAMEERLVPPVVYHVFGRANSLPNYVVTEEDLLDIGHQWQDENRRPQCLAGLLRDKYLLMLGCSFQNWLSRFFLCALKSDALFARQHLQGVVADERTRRDEELSLFLSRCQTRLYPEGGAKEFVVELSRQWREHAAETGAVQEVPLSESPSRQTFRKGALFISYASEDRAAAAKIRQRLEAANFDVWFDEQRLDVGDQFEGKILRNIKESSFFLPIISRHVLTADRRFFRLEWNSAIKESPWRPPGLPFILPVAIDDTSENAPFIPPEFASVQWARLPGGEVSEGFLDMCRRHVRELRRKEESRR